MDEDHLRLSKQERIRRRKDYLEIYAKGEKFHTPYFVVYLSENNLPRHRLGITVSRKVGSAVVRNRIKRRLREIFRNNKQLIRPPSDIVLNVKTRASSASFAALEGAFREGLACWGRGGIT